MMGVASSLADHLPLYREAARIVRAMIENVIAVTPLPGGSSLFAVEMTDQLLDRVAVWGAEIEDCEPDDDLEPDDRDLPSAAARLGLIQVATVRPLAFGGRAGGRAIQGRGAVIRPRPRFRGVSCLPPSPPTPPSKANVVASAAIPRLP